MYWSCSSSTSWNICFLVGLTARVALEVTSAWQKPIPPSVPLFTRVFNTYIPDSHPNCVVAPVHSILIMPPWAVNVTTFPASHNVDTEFNGLVNSATWYVMSTRHPSSDRTLGVDHCFSDVSPPSVRNSSSGKCDHVEGGAKHSAAPQSVFLQLELVARVNRFYLDLGDRFFVTLVWNLAVLSSFVSGSPSKFDWCQLLSISKSTPRITYLLDVSHRKIGAWFLMHWVEVSLHCPSSRASESDAWLSTLHESMDFLSWSSALALHCLLKFDLVISSPNWTPSPMPRCQVYGSSTECTPDRPILPRLRISITALASSVLRNCCCDG